MTIKLMTHLFAATLALGLSACGGGSDAPAPAASPTPAPSTSPSPSPAPTPAPAPSPTPAPAPTPSPTPAPTPTPTPSPAPAPVASGGTASECFNAVFHTAGTTFKFDYAISGSATGKTVSNGSVKADASFNGNSGLVELTQDQTTTYTAPATLAAAGTVPTLSKFYFKLDGNIESEYGGTITTSVSAAGLSISSVTTVVYNPVVQDKRFTLALNGSTTYQTSAASTTAVSGFPGSQTTSSIARTITYMGQETITIPAGTFVACKFKESDKDGDQFVWHGKGNGAPLKMTSKASDNSSIVMELTAATLVNGKPL